MSVGGAYQGDALSGLLGNPALHLICNVPFEKANETKGILS